MTRREESLIALLVVVTAGSLYPNVTEAVQTWKVKQRRVHLAAIELSKNLQGEHVSRLQPAFVPSNAAVIDCAEDWVDRVPAYRAQVPVRMIVKDGKLAEVSLEEGAEVEAELAACVIEAVRTITPAADLTTPAFVATWRFQVYHSKVDLPTVEVLPEQFFGGY